MHFPDPFSGPKSLFFQLLGRFTALRPVQELSLAESHLAQHHNPLLWAASIMSNWFGDRKAGPLSPIWDNWKRLLQLQSFSQVQLNPGRDHTRVCLLSLSDSGPFPGSTGVYSEDIPQQLLCMPDCLRQSLHGADLHLSKTPHLRGQIKQIICSTGLFSR